MITVLLVRSWNGHHPSYCAEMIRACAGFSSRIYVLCPPAANPLEQVGGPPDLLEKVSVVVHANRADKTGFRKLSDIVADLREMRSQVLAIQQSHPGERTFIFHTSLDSWCIGILHLPLLAMCIRRLLPWPFSGLLITPDREWPLSTARRLLTGHAGKPQDRSRCKKARDSLANGLLAGVAYLLRRYYLWQRNRVFKKSRCENIAIQDERYADALRRQTGKNVVLYPETTTTQVANPPPELVRLIDAKRNGRVVVGLLGRINRGKCADLLLDVIRNFDTSAFLFVFAGNCQLDGFSPDHRALLEGGIQEAENVVFSPVPIPSESDFNAVIAACDIIYTVYRDHFHSSNIISKAVAFRKPVLVTAGQLMAKRVTDYGIGRILPEHDATTCFQALREMGTPEYQENFLRTAGFADYMKDHSFDVLRSLMTTLSSNNP